MIFVPIIYYGNANALVQMKSVEVVIFPHEFCKLQLQVLL